MYKKLTRLDRSGRFIPVYYGMENFDKGFDFSKHPDKVCNKMIYLTSPFSGIEYGGRGGYAGTKLKNRAAFEAVKNILTPHDLLALMQYQSCNQTLGHGIVLSKTTIFCKTKNCDRKSNYRNFQNYFRGSNYE